MSPEDWEKEWERKTEVRSQEMEEPMPGNIVPMVKLAARGVRKSGFQQRRYCEMDLIWQR